MTNRSRTDEAATSKEDHYQSGAVLYGRAISLQPLTSDAVWQIKRVYRLGSVITTEYADFGKYRSVWDDRATHFPALPPANNSPVIYNIVMATSNTETAQALPADTTRFTLKCRGSAALILSYEALATSYLTIPSHIVYEEGGLDQASPITLYFQSPTAGTVVEIIAWRQ